jgi:hypothetical protein
MRTLHSRAFDEKMTLDPWSLGWRIPARDGRRAADDHPCSDIETSHDGIADRARRVVEVDIDLRAGSIEVLAQNRQPCNRPGECVAILRWSVGRDPDDRDLSDLVGELATHSEEFRTRWAAHDVRFHNTGVKRFHHPVVGDLTLSYNRLDLAADHGLAIVTYAAEPGSRSEEALKLLGSWSATLDLAEASRASDQS